MAMQESGLLQAASPFYKTFAIECSRAQVSVDMFLFSSAYQDVATLGTTLTLLACSLLPLTAFISLSPPLHFWPDILLPSFQRRTLRGRREVRTRVR